MFYPGRVMYPSRVELKTEDDVLDLCVRKRENEEKYPGDVNGNGYPDPNGYCNVACTGSMVVQPRYSHEVEPTPIAAPTYPEERNTPGPVQPGQAFGESRVGFFPTSIACITARNGKPTRPFKAYPKDFLPLATSEGFLDDSNQRYMEFRQQFLAQLHANSGLPSNKNTKRPVEAVSPNQVPSSSGDVKDKAYWERRKKNNEAAKKSRDARRAKEDEIAIRAAFLERENVRLKLELATLRSETDRLRCLLYST